MGKKKARKIRDHKRRTNSIGFIKAEATGNDFIIVDVSKHLDQLSLRTLNHLSTLAVRICARRFGIGADGLVVLRRLPDKGANYQWDFFNSDGTRAEMCGNAARCVVAYGFLENQKSKQISIAIKKQKIVGTKKLGGAIFEISLGPPTLLIGSGSISFKANPITFSWIDSGVPHVVLRNEAVDRSLAVHLRKSRRFGPAGTNVTFFRVLKKGVISAVTYERGVEDFTLSCGTGVIAAAWAYLKFEWSNQQVRVETPGGKLYVQFTMQKRVYLAGPAHITGEGRYFL